MKVIALIETDTRRHSNIRVIIVVPSDNSGSLFNFPYRTKRGKRGPVSRRKENNRGDENNEELLEWDYDVNIRQSLQWRRNHRHAAQPREKSVDSLSVKIYSFHESSYLYQSSIFSLIAALHYSIHYFIIKIM